MKKLISLCLTAALLGLLWNIAFNFFLNPSLRFWQRCAETSDAWEQQLRTSSEPCYIFGGGSETRIGIDPQILLDQYQVRAVNAAANAGNLPLGNAKLASCYLKPGDTLVFPVEYALGFNGTISNSGLQFTIRRLGMKTFEDGFIPFQARHVKPALLGNPGVISFSFVKKLFLGGSVYNYESQSVIHPSGWMEVLTNTSFPPTQQCDFPPKLIFDISDTQKANLKELCRFCNMHHVRLLLYHHTQYMPINSRPFLAMQTTHLIREDVQVLRDERFGVEPDSTLFSDTRLHLNKQGMERNMQFLGPALQQREVWTEESIAEELRKYGYDIDGNRLPENEREEE